MMKEMNRRTFLKAVGVAGAVSAMTALVGCSGGVIVPDGSTSLANLKPLNGYYDWNNTLPEDPFGNTYTTGANAIVLEPCGGAWNNTTYDLGGTYRGKVEYSLDKKYTKLTMKLNPYKGTQSEGWATVSVYADKKLVKTSPAIRQKTKEPVEFEVDITNAEYIEIEVVISNSKYEEEYASLIMWDAKLWK